MTRFFNFLYFLFLVILGGGGGNREIRDTCIRGDQISHIQSIVAKRGLTNREHSYSYVKKSFKTQRSRIPIDPAILLQLDIVHSKKKRIFLIPMRGSEATRADTRNRRPFWGLTDNTQVNL